MSKLGLHCNASSLLFVQGALDRLRCCFSESVLGPCLLVQDATVDAQCVFPAAHPRNDWFIRPLDLTGPSVHAYRNGTVFFYTPELASSQHQFRTCTGSVDIPSDAPRLSTDTALALSFAAGLLLGGSITLLARRALGFVYGRRTFGRRRLGDDTL